MKDVQSARAQPRGVPLRQPSGTLKDLLGQRHGCKNPGLQVASKRTMRGFDFRSGQFFAKEAQLQDIRELQKMQRSDEECRARSSDGSRRTNGVRVRRIKRNEKTRVSVSAQKLPLSLANNSAPLTLSTLPP